MEQQPHRALWMKEIKQKNKARHIQTDHSFFDLAHKQCGGIINGFTVWRQSQKEAFLPLPIIYY